MTFHCQKAVDSLKQTGGGGLGGYKMKYPWWDLMVEVTGMNPAIEPDYLLQSDESFGPYSPPVRNKATTQLHLKTVDFPILNTVRSCI